MKLYCVVTLSERSIGMKDQANLFHIFLKWKIGWVPLESRIYLKNAFKFDFYKDEVKKGVMKVVGKK